MADFPIPFHIPELIYIYPIEVPVLFRASQYKLVEMSGNYLHKNEVIFFEGEKYSITP